MILLKANHSNVPEECIHLQESTCGRKVEEEDRLFLHNLQYALRFDSVHLIVHLLSPRYVDEYSENYYEANFPVDDSGKTCAYDYPDQPYVYFSNPNDLSSGRYCVSSCPGLGEALQCS